MRITGWYVEKLPGAPKRDAFRAHKDSHLDRNHPIRSILDAAQEIQKATGRKADAVELTEAEFKAIEASPEALAASRFIYGEPRPVKDVLANILGLRVVVGIGSWR